MGQQFSWLPDRHSCTNKFVLYYWKCGCCQVETQNLYRHCSVQEIDMETYLHTCMDVGFVETVVALYLFGVCWLFMLGTAGVFLGCPFCRQWWSMESSAWGCRSSARHAGWSPSRLDTYRPLHHHCFWSGAYFHMWNHVSWILIML